MHITYSCYDPVELSLKAKHYMSTGDVLKAQEIPEVAASNTTVMETTYTVLCIGNSE